MSPTNRIAFEFEGKQYSVDMDAYPDVEQIKLPDGRHLDAHWLETWPPQAELSISPDGPLAAFMAHAQEKGAKDGACNVTACQEPPATFYNKSTRKYYCRRCADMINWPGGRKDTLELYGVELLCEEDSSPTAHNDTIKRYG